MDNIFGIKGILLFTKSFGKYEIIPNGYIIINSSKIIGVYDKLPSNFLSINIIDYSDCLIIPGFVDLHLHGPQFPNLGLGLDKELLPWLETYTFPEENKFSDMSYAKKVYSNLIHQLWQVGTTRSCVFSSIHKESTKILMDLFNDAGLGAFVGKVNMDRNCPYYLQERTSDSITDTEDIIIEYLDKYPNVKPIITPRFVPTCSKELLIKLGNLSHRYNVPIQSHLSENENEIEYVRSLHPEYQNYSDVYEQCGILKESKTIMAHCVYLSDEEIDLLAKKSIYVAHCPNSNSNLSSGIAPIRKLIDKGIKVGLATDISGGHTLNISNVITSAIQISNLNWLKSSKKELPLSLAEAFYLATKGGGEFFGNVGSFENEYEFDALIIDDNKFPNIKNLTIEERLQRFIYSGDINMIKARYVSGKLIDEPILYSN